MRRLLLLLALPACSGSPAKPDMAPPEATYQNLLVSNNPKLDVLFMVDNSPSMGPMQQELQQRFPQFLTGFHELAADGLSADLHIGVVTSDFGAPSGGNCGPSPGGQKGLLQAIGAAAEDGCLPPVGAPYIRYVVGPNGGPNNLPDGQDLDATFTCMASVGAKGCWLEHQLESTYAALHAPENAGFLRDDARLMVVFITNEDDGSTPADSDLFDRSKQEYGDVDYRPIRYGLLCDGEPPPCPSNGPLRNCAPAPNPNGAGPGKLYDVSRYIDFLGKPRSQGGLKEHPEDVTLVGVDAPAVPVITLFAFGDPGSPNLQPCARPDDPLCTPLVQHSCTNPQNPAFFGAPSVRLNAVISAAPNHKLGSICDGDYTSTIEGFGVFVAGQIGGCLPWRFPDLDQPECDVVEEATLDDGTTRVYPLTHCSDADPGAPCWGLEKHDYCVEYSPQGVALAIDRRGQAAPPKTTARVNCLAIPPS